MLRTIWKVLTRRKVIDHVSVNESGLARVLNTFDLTALGVGSTLGVGVYVLAGHVAKDTAGPSVVLSFLIAAITSVFAGLCYAEFGARAPKAGSAYIYSYVCVGEFIAFVIGWNLILEYVIGSASVAKGLSSYLDTLLNNTLKETFIEIAPIKVSFMSQYFDFLAFGVSFLLAVALAFGMKESSMVNNIITFLNLGVVVFIIIAGSIKAHGEYWTIDPHDINSTVANATDVGKGGFFPFGVEGMIKGAATCFYGFVGFDCIATTGEEVKNPQKAIPLSIILSLLIIFLSYFGTSTVITLMVPYYAQDVNAPIPHAFEEVGWNFAKWIVAIGGIFGLCASLFGAMFPLPRIIYAMASDGVIFKILGKVSERFQTPVIGTLLAGILTGLMAALFDLKQLVDMMSIGTLQAYTIVAASVLLLRYSVSETENYLRVNTVSDSDEGDMYTSNRIWDNVDGEELTQNDENELLDQPYPNSITVGKVFKQIFNCSRNTMPTKLSERIVTIEVFLYCIVCLLFGLCIMYFNKSLLEGDIVAIVLTSCTIGLALIILLSLILQPMSHQQLSFKVPLVPLIPALSILVNIYLMLMLDSHTWIRFGAWMAVGIPVYFFSVRKPTPKLSVETKKLSKLTSSNGILPQQIHINNGFITNEDKPTISEPTESESEYNILNKVENKRMKKKLAPLPPQRTEKTNTIKMVTESPATVLEKFDEMLKDEDDTSISFIIDSCNMSLTSLSSVCNVPIEENVVADLYFDSIVTVPATPIPDSTSMPETNPTVTPYEINITPVNALRDREKLAANEYLNIQSNNGKSNEVNIESNEVINDETNELINDESKEVIKEKNSSNSETIDENKVQSASKVKESETVIPIPPPPPINPPPLNPTLNGEFNRSVSRLTLKDITAKDLSTVRLKPSKTRATTPDIDYTPPIIEISPLPETNLKRNDPFFKAFSKKLNEQLKKPSFNLKTNLPLLERRPHSVTAIDEKAIKENVIAEAINKEAAKEAMDEVLKKRITNNSPVINTTEENQSKDENNSEQLPLKRTESETDFEEHQRRMNDIFKSINLKKKESFGKTLANNSEALHVLLDKNTEHKTEAESSKTTNKPKGLNNESSDVIKHRKNMSNIFKSIRLRKVDSFKTENATNSE